MTSTLVIISVEHLQNKINKTMLDYSSLTGIYVSLNKTQKSIEETLEKVGISTKKIFFIDCVTTEKTRDDVLHISPDQLETLNAAIDTFLKDIKGEKFLIIDALSTLLIYNDEDTVAKFIKEVTDACSQHGVTAIAFSPKTKGEELLNKIFRFFDTVEKE